MALSNKFGSMLLTTGNKSEMSVGYATLYGDMCGGFSVLKDIYKTEVYRLSRWRNANRPSLAKGPHGEVIPERTLTRPPTAELRPPASGQTDEGDLMPYELLDAIEGSAIRDRRTPLEVFQEMHARFPAYQVATLVAYVERFFRLWCRNQWKRERYAPSFHVDDKNLDPKTWCRFPILSGGFERELAELRAYVARL